MRSTWLALLLFVSLGGVSAAPVRTVLVVGGGIGGASCAYELRKRFPAAQVTVAEREPRVGGRLYSIMFHGRRVNVGGDAWATSNQCMRRVQHELNISLSTDNYGGNNRSGIWDGTRFYPPAPPVWSEAKLGATLLAVRAALARNYDHRGTDGTYSSIAEYLVSGSLLDKIARDSAAHFAADVLSPFFTFAYWTPLTRVIYDQTLETMNLFAAVAAVLGSTGESFSARDGNDAVVATLLQHSGATVLRNTTVSAVARSNATGPLAVTLNGAVREFDRVVIAAPLETAKLAISVSGAAPWQPRRYRHWYVTIVAADAINPAAFGATTPVPDSIVTTANTTTPWTMCAVLSRGTDNSNIYKCFSNVDIRALLPSLFVAPRPDAFVHLWPATFPDLSPVAGDYQPTVLAPGLLSLGAMESVAVALEAAVISGRNAAILLSQESA